MCKVTQFFNSKKVGVDAVDDVLFLASLYMEYCKNGGDGDIFLLFLKLY